MKVGANTAQARRVRGAAYKRSAQEPPAQRPAKQWFVGNSITEWIVVVLQFVAVGLVFIEVGGIRNVLDIERTGHQQNRAYDLILRGFEPDLLDARQNIRLNADDYNNNLLVALKFRKLAKDDSLFKQKEYNTLVSDIHHVLTFLEIVATCFESNECASKMRPIAQESFHDSAELLCPLLIETLHKDTMQELRREYHKDFENFFFKCDLNGGEVL